MVMIKCCSLNACVGILANDKGCLILLLLKSMLFYFDVSEEIVQLYNV